MTDIIKACQRISLEFDAEDTSLYNNVLNYELLKFLCRTDCSIRTLIFTKSVTFGNNGLKIRDGFVVATKRDAFSLFLKACQNKEIIVHLRNPVNLEWIILDEVNNEVFRNLVHLKMSIVCPKLGNHKEFNVITPPSPAAINRNVRNNRVYIRWKHHNQYGTPINFFEGVYHATFNDDFEFLGGLNVK